jgi:SAM-dependent MidA family methyltransferase
VGLDPEERLTFGLAPGAPPPGLSARPGEIIEVSPAQAAFGAALGRLVGAAGGAGLLIDYGRARPEPGDTFQGLRRHAKVSPLEAPGHVDLTVWADFPSVLAAALGPADVTGVVPQGAFLKRLGLEARVESLVRSNPQREPMLRRQAARLSDADQMGELFKAAAVFAPKRLQVPGFEG